MSLVTRGLGVGNLVVRGFLGKPRQVIERIWVQTTSFRKFRKTGRTVTERVHPKP